MTVDTLSSTFTKIFDKEYRMIDGYNIPISACAIATEYINDASKTAGIWVTRTHFVTWAQIKSITLKDI